jgi:hypothetical protein
MSTTCVVASRTGKKDRLSGMYSQKRFQKQKPPYILFLSFVLSVFFIPTDSCAQKRELTVLGKVVKIGLVDHSELRKEFRAYAAARVAMATENQEKRKAFMQALQALEQQTAQQVAADSAKGGGQREQIISGAAVRRAAMEKMFKDEERRRNSDRIALTQEYERKIQLAIEAVVNEGGFTDIKPLFKDSTAPKGVNITSLLLQKLN